MIWGMTNEEYIKHTGIERAAKMARERQPVMTFAILPVRLVDGRMAWFEMVMKSYYHVLVGDHSGDYCKFAEYNEIKKPPNPPRRAGDP